MVITNRINNDIISFCNKTDNYYKYDDCYFNPEDPFLKYSTRSILAYKNLTDSIKIKNNITNINENSEMDVADFNLISLITQITLLIVYLLFFNNVQNQIEEVDIRNLSAQDYTLMISEFNLPFELKEFKDLKSYLETEVNKLKFQ
jgi:hypothetical protein